MERGMETQERLKCPLEQVIKYLYNTTTHYIYMILITRLKDIKCNIRRGLEQFLLGNKLLEQFLEPPSQSLSFLLLKTVRDANAGLTKKIVYFSV